LVPCTGNRSPTEWSQPGRSIFSDENLVRAERKGGQVAGGDKKRVAPEGRAGNGARLDQNRVVLLSQLS
jgi:hypothetical protein